MKKFLSVALAAFIVLSAIALCSCSKNDDKVIKVGASVTPHAEILNVIKDEVAKQGYTLEVVEYEDYVIPNTATESGELFANYFQHQPYLTDFNANNGTHLVAVCAVHYEPYAIYAGKTASLDALADGAKVSVPNDATNEARALLLLEQVGLLKLKEGAGIAATKLDIVENPKNLEIVEIEAAQLVRTLADVDISIINGNYALQGNLNIADALAVEAADGVAATTYANILVVKEGNENSEKATVLKNALLSETVENYINNTYAGKVVPSF
ncbi:MAG: metal ABC transporter substrate-binding protein [Firmicutes bacterium]|nr:metal ABC transporter substrate-binding protein [Candidatus Colimorpha enterica]